MSTSPAPGVASKACPALSTSVGFRWHSVQSKATARLEPLTCAGCATKLAEALDSGAPGSRGGAPVELTVPPWQKRQSERHAVGCAGGGLWQLSQLGAAPAPSSVGPWQPRQS